jgi:hypothetical protein
MSLTYANSLSNTGTCVLSQTGVPSVTWNLTFLEISFQGPSYGPNARLSIWDGPIGGTLLFRDFLNQPSGSVGIVQKINLPQDQNGNIGIQALTGNTMNIVVDGFGTNQCSINARLTDGLPTGRN